MLAPQVGRLDREQRVFIPLASPVRIDHEAITPSRECFDILRTIGGVAKRPPENTHGNIDAVPEINDGVVRPEFIFDFVSGDDLATALDQDLQDLEWLFAKENSVGILRHVRWIQLARAHIQFKLSKSDTVSGKILPYFGRHPIHGADYATGGKARTIPDGGILDRSRSRYIATSDTLKDVSGSRGKS